VYGRESCDNKSINQARTVMVRIQFWGPSESTGGTMDVLSANSSTLY